MVPALDAYWFAVFELLESEPELLVAFRSAEKVTGEAIPVPVTVVVAPVAATVLVLVTVSLQVELRV